MLRPYDDDDDDDIEDPKDPSKTIVIAAITAAVTALMTSLVTWGLDELRHKYGTHKPEKDE